MEESYLVLLRWSATARGTLREKTETLYRDCQRFATDEIGKGVAELNLVFVRAEALESKDQLRSRVNVRLRGLTRMALT